ncbi:MAG TPA: signal peptidase II, partial [Syntrophomonas sp.]|nr:signal peptidase II [Syntrophomonas sp.]
QGHVVDFIDFRFWPVFNVADIAIVMGGILLVAYFIWWDKDGQSNER